LTDAVRIRLRADVQVAAYLSGGLDSSATTALIKKVAPETLQTFSIGFEDNEFDETPYQQEVSKYLGTRHTAFTCTRQDIGNYFPQVVWHSEIPILRTAPVPMFCLSKKVRENNIKVVITGKVLTKCWPVMIFLKKGSYGNSGHVNPIQNIDPYFYKSCIPTLLSFRERTNVCLNSFLVINFRILLPHSILMF